MSASLRHRRRAERFAQLLDEAGGGRRQHLRTPLDEELGELVALRHQLIAADPGPEVDPEFRTGLRAMLVATAEREGIGRTARPEPAAAPAPRRGARAVAGTLRPARGPRARTAVVAGVAVGAVAFTGMSTASENAVPGDALYGVKRSTERAQLALASSEVGRGQLYLGFAQTRLAEARILGTDLRVLDDMDRDTTHGVRLLTAAAANRQDLSALDAVDRFATGQRAALAELTQEASGADLARVTDSLDLLDTIERRTAELRQSLQDCSGPSATSLDSLGPVPRACVALPAPSTLNPRDQAGPGGADRPADPAGDAGPQTGPTGPTGQAPSAGPAETGPTAPAEQPEQPDDPAADAGDSPAEEPSDSGAEPADEDGGLLSGINRLLGNLLGG